MIDQVLGKLTSIRHHVEALLLTGLIERVCSYLLKRTESIAANSTRELIALGLKRLFKRENSNMTFSKSFVGPAGSSLSIEAANGEVKIVASESGELGGGEVQGFLKVKGSAEIDLEDQMIIDAGLDMAAAKFPMVASLIQGAKAAIDAELSKA